MPYPIKTSPLSRFNDEQKLIYLSDLQTLPENSRFIFRLSLASVMLLSSKKRDRNLYNKVGNLVVNGNYNEDPQEELFVTTVNTPKGYYRVFYGLFSTCPNVLSRMLYTAEENGHTELMNRVYSLLELCDTMALRSGCARYIVGNSEAEFPSGYNWYEFDQAKDRVVFTADELNQIFLHNDCDAGDWQRYLFTAKPKAIEADVKYKGYSDLYELRPLFRLHDGRVLVLQPSALMRCAYAECKRLYSEAVGKNNFYTDYYRHLVGCVEDIVYDHGGALNCYHALVDNKTYTTAYQYDSERVANIVVYQYGLTVKEDEAFLVSASYLKQQHPDCELFNLLVFDSLIEEVFGLGSQQMDLSMHIDDLEVMLCRKNFNLRDLWNYALAKKKVQFPPMSQELDIMSIYINQKESFYFGREYNIIMPDFGSGLLLRRDHYVKYDTHVVDFEGVQLKLIHDSDVPQRLPYYKIGEDSDTTIVELGNTLVRLVTSGVNPVEKDACLVVYHAFAYWSYVLWSNGLLQFASDQLTVNRIPDLDADVEELDVIREMLEMLQEEKAVEVDIPKALEYINSTGIHYLQLNNSNDLLLINDGVKDNYQLSDYHVDMVLGEIAGLLGRKPGEVKLTLDESKTKTLDVLRYLEREAKSIIQQFDCAQLIHSMITLFHSMTFWQRQTKYRYEGLSAAFKFLGDNIEQQILDANRYTEVSMLATSILEYIIISDIQTPAKPQMNVRDVDRLFALVHHVVGFGNYFDMLVNDVENCELTILENGRVELPVAQIEKTNSYMRALYNQTMETPSLLGALHSLMPDHSVDTDSEEFKQAYGVEFGIDYVRHMRFIGDVWDEFLASGNPLFCMKVDDFRQKFFSDFTDEEFDRFTGSYFLSAKCAKGYNPSEFFLQRQNRAVQLSTRPIVLYNGMVYFSTKTLIYREQVILDRINAAKIVYKSLEMKAYNDMISGIKGHEFVQHVADYYKGICDANLDVYSEVAIEPGKLLNADKNYGDIDVMIVNKEKRMIVSIEAKNYAESHTTYEILMQYRKAKKDVKKAERRDEWCKKNLAQFSKVCKDCDETYRVKTIFLTYHEPVMRHLQAENSSVVTYLSAIELVKNPYCVFD